MSKGIENLNRYDPDRGPDAKQWLALDEDRRRQLAEEYHAAEGIDLPNSRMHASLHAIIETQVARGDEIPVAATLARLIDEGLSRHEALHCMMLELAHHMQDIAADAKKVPSNLGYYARLMRANAYGWLNRADPDDEDDDPPKRPQRRKLRFRP